eukprot:3591582-Pyramimonas_sp.AAC.1
MLEEVIGDASSPSTVKEVDNLISEMLKEASGEVSKPPTAKGVVQGSVEWTEEEPLADPRLQHLMAIQLLNDAMDKAEDDPDTMCVLRGVDGKGELLPLSTPTYAGEAAHPGWRARAVAAVLSFGHGVGVGRTAERA